MVDTEDMEKKTAEQILDVAQEMVRRQGYSAFSYADISKRIGIRKASIHYHFPSKADLVQRLVQRYREILGRACDRIARSNAPANEQLLEFAHLYRDGLKQDQACLCAMLGADYVVLPEPVQAEVREFFHQTEQWLATLLQKGSDDQLWHCNPSAEQEAKGLIAMLQGAQLLARPEADSFAAFEQIVYPLLLAKASKP